MNQRHPRIRDEKYLTWLRTLPCCVCGGGPKNDAAHIRSGSLVYDKPITGMGEKPDDKWALPQCRSCHRTQHQMNEMAYWRSMEIDPFLMAQNFYKKAGELGETSPKTAKKARKPWPKPKGFGEKRKIPSRKFGT